MSFLKNCSNKKFSVAVATLAFLFSVLDADSQVLEGGIIRLNSGNPQTEQVGNPRIGNVNGQKFSGYGQSFGKLGDLVADKYSLEVMKNWPSNNLEGSYEKVYESLLLELLKGLGIDIDEIFPEGLPNYSQLFETVPKGGNYLNSLNELIEAAKKFILEGWTFLTNEERNYMELILSFINDDGSCSIDEEHKKYLPKNVFPGAIVEKSRVLSNGCIYIPTKNGSYVIDKYGKCRKIDFSKIFNNVFIKPYLESVNAFIQNPDEWTAEDLGKSVNSIQAALEGATYEDIASDEEKTEQIGKNVWHGRFLLKNFLKKVLQWLKKKSNREDMSNIGEIFNNPENELSYSESKLDEDLINYILRIACLNPEDTKLLRLCLKGKIVFTKSYVDIGKDRYYYIDVIDKEEVDKAVLDGYTVHGKTGKGNISWIIRDGKLDWVVPKNSKSSLEDSIYDNELNPVENNSRGYIYNETGGDDSSGIVDEEIIGINPDDESIYDGGSQL